jgi:hypothetical protein
LVCVDRRGLKVIDKNVGRPIGIYLDKIANTNIYRNGIVHINQIKV